MIKNMTPLSMAEAMEYVKKDDNLDVKAFVKKFTNLTPEKAKEIRDKLEKLDLIKLGTIQMIKIIDLLPGNSEELNKIIDVSLDEDETKKILETIKEYK